MNYHSNLINLISKLEITMKQFISTDLKDQKEIDELSNIIKTLFQIIKNEIQKCI